MYKVQRAALTVLLVLLPTVARAEASDGQRLARYLAAPANDRAVRQDVERWHGTMRNGCVAYLSTALRRIGVPIPERGVHDGEGVSRITRAFSWYLEQTLGWTRVVDESDLRAGDLVFTTDVAPGYPAHVCLFHRWRRRGAGVAVVSDNQGHLHARALHPAPGSATDPFAYALRAPDPPAAR